MQTTRRQTLKGLTLGAGATLLNPMIGRVLANQQGQRGVPARFVFVLQGNGFDGIQVCPESIPYQRYEDREDFQEFKLNDHRLPAGMDAFEKMKDRLTVIQGLSGRCTGGGHSIHGGALGLYRTSNASRSPANITVDYRLGEAVPGILPWVGVGMSPGGRGALMDMTARAAHKSLPILLKPEDAYNAFFSVAAGGKAEQRFHLKRNLLDYMVTDVKKAQQALGPVGGQELEAYLSAYDELAKRQYSLLKHKDALANAIQPMDGRFTSAVATERMEAQFDIASTALIGGLSNVATITCAATEINVQPYLGIGIEDSCHTIGHRGGSERDSKGTASYLKYRGWLFGLIANMVKRFEAIPEGNGTMMDNTVIVFMSDAPDTHHSTAYEWPLVVLGNLKGRMKLGGRYINYPGYGKIGHRTVGSFYTTLLHSVGLNDSYFGSMDTELGEAKMQTGSLPQLQV